MLKTAIIKILPLKKPNSLLIVWKSFEWTTLHNKSSEWFIELLTLSSDYNKSKLEVRSLKKVPGIK